MSQPSVHPGAKAQPQAMTTPPPRPPFDIDNYLNPFIPRNPLYLLPRWMSFVFGYRPPRQTPPPPPSRHRFHTLIMYTSVMIGAFCGVAIIENVFLALPRLSGHAVPIIIASFGAAAILEYNTIESPLAQPRNLVFGHFFSAVVAVGITKLFEHLPPDRFEQLRWLAGALAVGAASMLMSFTKTVHPPAGATALLAATNVEIQVLGWWLLPLVLLAAMLMLASALVLNNLAGRRFPIYWWTPVDLKALREERRQEKRAKKGEVDMDVEKGGESTTPSESEAEAEKSQEKKPTKDDEGDDEDEDGDVFEAETEAGSHDIDLRKSLQLSRTISYSAASRKPRRLSSES